ncbi:hypothetical protein [Microseira wollei]|uniref:Uncharacterized protein n=1 Tax=Microseira wollei NIES-4236 TaxID=2530354 RepID=A0AAV3X5Y4_9CYAN|nr:hypothetical protein [Microseira wollei]GET35744.1 hypothetical protein MiSe_04890 [Microseira wollei NIES-4236]
MCNFVVYKNPAVDLASRDKGDRAEFEMEIQLLFQDLRRTSLETRFLAAIFSFKATIFPRNPVSCGDI